MTSSLDGIVGKKFGNSNKLGNTDKDDNIIIGNKKNSSNKGKTKMDINNILEKKSKKEVTTYKYSNNGRDSLHEAIILNGKPCFITYDKQNDTIQIKDLIEESTRIINPPSQEGYPYTPYEFESEKELNEFFSRAKKIASLDPLYETAKSIFQKYVDQDVHIITILSVDCILTHFQDLFPTIHYSEGIGDNDVGKSSIGYTFEYTAYRVVKGTSISGANYYRLLGTIEPGQCTIIEDEGDNISDDPDKIRLLEQATSLALGV